MEHIIFHIHSLYRTAHLDSDAYLTPDDTTVGSSENLMYSVSLREHRSKSKGETSSKQEGTSLKERRKAVLIIQEKNQKHNSICQECTILTPYQM